MDTNEGWVQPLDYQTNDFDEKARPGVALVALPLAAGAVTLAVAGHNFVEEPFGFFSPGDAVVQVGGPLVVLGLWVAWAVVAVRRRRPRFPGLAVVLCWAASNLWIAEVFFVAYFREPWNR